MQPIESSDEAISRYVGERKILSFLIFSLVLFQDDRYCFWCLDEWDGTCECLFSTDVKEQCAEQGSSDYFFGSSNKIHYFLEPGAVDTDSGNLKPGCDKLLSLNKVGHALHVLDPVFREYSFSDKVKALVSKLGYQDPVLPQSMYILKNAKVGGEVTSHQDSTFLYTTPKLTCLGLWLALDEATEENGCLWARLGSHKEKLRKRWKRKESQGIEMEFQVFDDTEKAVLEGQTLQDVTPDHLREKGFSSLPCEAGDLVCKSLLQISKDSS